MIHEAGAGAKIAAAKKWSPEKVKALKAKAVKANQAAAKAKELNWSPEKVKALKAKAVAANQAQKAATAAGRMKGGAGAPSAISRIKGMAGKKVAAGKAAVAKKAAAVKASINKATGQAAYDKALAKGPGKHMGDLPPKKLTAAGKAKSAAKVYGKAAGKAVSKFAQTPAGKAVGGAAAAAMAIYAGAKIYKRFFSQAAKACSGKSGAEKTACMGKYKKQAIMKQASAIQSAASKCAKSKDPAKCKAAVAAKVNALKAKAAKVA